MPTYLYGKRVDGIDRNTTSIGLDSLCQPQPRQPRRNTRNSSSPPRCGVAKLSSPALGAASTPRKDSGQHANASFTSAGSYLQAGEWVSGQVTPSTTSPKQTSRAQSWRASAVTLVEEMDTAAAQSEPETRRGVLARWFGKLTGRKKGRKVTRNEEL
jgi:hypothetical protein